jgi:5-methylcytosine-specific restriction endonuclease McrA
MTVQPDRGALAFAEKMLGLLRDGSFTATYKYAVILGLMDLCLEQSGRSGAAPSMVTTRQLAEKVVELYWTHTLPFERDTVLKQNSRGQVKILNLIDEFRTKHPGASGATSARAHRSEPTCFERLLCEVEWVLVKMPLPKLQRIGTELHPFIYQINWIRPFVQREWTERVSRINKDVVQQSQLEDFLFGANRIALGRVRKDLRELQNGRCFYCGDEIRSSPQVDHFVPWSRYPNNGIENLVLTHSACNNAKRDHLASAEHVGKWAERSQRESTQLSTIARMNSWESHPERSFSVAQAIYLRLPEGARLWQRAGDFVPVNRTMLMGVFQQETASG